MAAVVVILNIEFSFLFPKLSLYKDIDQLFVEHYEGSYYINVDDTTTKLF